MVGRKYLIVFAALLAACSSAKTEHDADAVTPDGDVPVADNAIVETEEDAFLLIESDGILSDEDEGLSGETDWSTDADLVSIDDLVLSSWSQLAGREGVPERYGAAVSKLGAAWFLSGGASHCQVEDDVWRSTDGVHWESLLENGAFPRRISHAMTTYHDRLWMAGGRGALGSLDDLWYSDDGRYWHRRCVGCPFGERDKPVLVALDDRLWLLGSRCWYGNGTPICESAYVSEDEGVTWTASPAPFEPRVQFGWTIHNDALYIIGGDDGDQVHNDVWSSTDGFSWEKLSDGPFTARADPKVLSFGGRLYLMGGMDENYALLTDVWSSADGVSWELVSEVEPVIARYEQQVVVTDTMLNLFGGYSSSSERSEIDRYLYQSTDALSWEDLFPDRPFTARQGHAAASFDGYLWVIGGWNRSDQNNYKSEIWRSLDGIYWERAIADAPFGTRVDASLAVYKGALWLVGGSTYGVGRQSDVWRSTNGKNWDQMLEKGPFPERSLASLFVFDDMLYLFGGEDDDGDLYDVWRTADGVAWEKMESFTRTSEPGRMLVHQGKIYAFHRNASQVYRSDDGNEWELLPAPPFSPRFGAEPVSYGDYLCLIGGHDANPLSEVWCSVEGAEWRFMHDAPFAPRIDFSVVIHDDAFVVVGGLDTRDAANCPLGDVWAAQIEEQGRP